MQPRRYLILTLIGILLMLVGSTLDTFGDGYIPHEWAWLPRTLAFTGAMVTIWGYVKDTGYRPGDSVW